MEARRCRSQLASSPTSPRESESLRRSWARLEESERTELRPTDRRLRPTDRRLGCASRTQARPRCAPRTPLTELSPTDTGDRAALLQGSESGAFCVIGGALLHAAVSGGPRPALSLSSARVVTESLGFPGVPEGVVCELTEGATYRLRQTRRDA